MGVKPFLATVVLILGITLAAYGIFRFQRMSEELPALSMENTDVSPQAVELRTEAATIQKLINDTQKFFSSSSSLSVLELAEIFVAEMDRNRIDIETYSLIDRDGIRGIDARFKASPSALFHFLSAMEQGAALIDFTRLNIVDSDSRSLSVSLKLRNAVPSENTEENTIDFKPVFGHQDTAWAFFGSFYNATRRSTIRQELPQLIPAPQWLILIGRYTNPDGEQTYALRDDRSGMIHYLSPGRKDDELMLTIDDEGLIKITVDDTMYILEDSTS